MSNEKEWENEEEPWKCALFRNISYCLKFSRSREDFIQNMGEQNYQVLWDHHKYISFITPDGKYCRNNKLYPADRFTKENLEKTFKKNRDNNFDDIPWLKEKAHREYRSFGDLLNSKSDLDCDLIIGYVEMPATFVWSASDTITEYGYEKFKAVLDCSYEVFENGNIAIDDGNEKIGEDFVLAAAGYISDNEYQKMFQSNDEHENDWDRDR